jgi:hypothetical protein
MTEVLRRTSQEKKQRGASKWSVIALEIETHQKGFMHFSIHGD